MNDDLTAGSEMHCGSGLPEICKSGNSSAELRCDSPFQIPCGRVNCRSPDQIPGAVGVVCERLTEGSVCAVWHSETGTVACFSAGAV
ncbi:MAG: hypothetical protein RLZZ232_1257 [Planctomycetota bacterium]